MSKEQEIEQLISLVENNMNCFIGIIAIMLAVFVIFQWRYSKSQTDKLKSDIEQQIVKKYHVNQLNWLLKREKTLENRIYSLNEKMGELKSLEEEHKKLLDNMESLETIRTIELSQTISSQFLKLYDPDMRVAMTAKEIIATKFREIRDNNFINQLMKSILVTDLYKNLKNSKPNDFTKELIEIIEKQAPDLLKRGEKFWRNKPQN